MRQTKLWKTFFSLRQVKSNSFLTGKDGDVSA